MRGKKSLQLIVIILLLIALGFTSSAVFAYWNEVSSLSNVVIEFQGEDASLIVQETSDSFEGKLVPQGYVYFEDEVDQVVFEYDVSVNKTLVNSMNLIVEATDVMIGGTDEYQQLVDIQIGNGNRYLVNELFNSVVHVTITVRLMEPIDAAEAAARGLGNEAINVSDSLAAFDAIKGQTITFTVHFKVEPK